MLTLFTREFWLAIYASLIRTLVAALAPFAAAALATPTLLYQGVFWLHVGLVVGLALVLAVATALAALPDATGLWWEIALQRSVRQFGQYIVAAAAGAVLLSDLNWQTVILAALGSAATTFFIAAATLGIPSTAVVVPGEVVEDVDDDQDGTTEGTAGIDQTSDTTQEA